MNKNSLVLRILGPVLLGLLNACSSGDVSVSVDGPIIGPILPQQTSEAITSYGEITGFGDLTVNDIRYSTGGATFTLNGQPGTVFDLDLGHIVTVTGEISSNNLSGTASSIRYDANLIGPLANIDAQNRRLLAMGQTVITGPDTVFAAGIDATSYAGLTVGDIVQVSGFADADGQLHATRIGLDNASTELQLIGRVAELDLANLSFNVNWLTIDYGGATLIDLPGGAPANGLTVKANGTIVNGVFIAERLVAAQDLVGITGQRVQAAGMVTRFNSSSDFDVNGSAAFANASTVYINGESSDVRPNTALVVDGEFAANDRITANRITFGHLAGLTTTLVFDLRDFNEIYVPTVFNISVTQGPEFQVEVVVDADVADRINVTKTGSGLNIALQAGDGNIDTLQALITMPVLDRIDLTGVVNATVSDFAQTKMTVNVGGVSRLQGDGLMIGDLSANVTGVSQLAFGNIRPLENANIDVSGVSHATLNMDIGSTLSGSVGTGQGTGTSMLFYYGTDVSLNVTTDFMSSVVKLGETRP